MTGPGEPRGDGWDEHYAASSGGVSITYYRNGVVKRVFPGGPVTFTFPDGKAEQFHLGDRIPYPPPPGESPPALHASPPSRTSGAGRPPSLARSLLQGAVLGVVIYLVYLAAAVFLL